VNIQSSVWIATLVWIKTWSKYWRFFGVKVGNQTCVLVKIMYGLKPGVKKSAIKHVYYSTSMTVLKF
jgi:hypothetical protein